MLPYEILFDQLRQTMESLDMNETNSGEPT